MIPTDEDPIVPGDPEEWADTVEQPKSMEELSKEYMAAALEHMNAPQPAIPKLFQGEPIDFAALMKDLAAPIAQRYERPQRIKLLSAQSPAMLEVVVNNFLDTGVLVARISDRIIRDGNQLVKEIHYYTGVDDLTARSVEVEKKVEPKPPLIVTATIVRAETKDGQWKYNEALIGTTVEVDLNRIEQVEGKDVIWLADGSHYIAVDFLELPSPDAAVQPDGQEVHNEQEANESGQ